MAKISVLNTDAGRTFTVGANDEIVGTATAADSIFVDASANGVVIQGNGGGDVITFAGSVSDYEVMQDGSRIKFINATNGATYVAVSAAATTINFSDATAVAKVEGANMMLGSQVITGLTTPTNITGTELSAGGTGFMLKDGQDLMTGTSGNDVYTSYILDNSNTFESGDIINGGAGTDTLNAEIGNSQNFAIGAKTTSVENMFFQAQATATDSADNFNSAKLDSRITDLLTNLSAVNLGDAVPAELVDGVAAVIKTLNGPSGPLGDMGYDFSYNNVSRDGYTQIDAQDLQGVRQLWSDNSRANLVIEDVREDSHTTTIGMRDTDPGNVNYEVYFDPQHITDPGSSSFGATMSIRLTDVLDLDETGNGLNLLPYSALLLQIGDEEVTLDVDFSELTSYSDFADKLQAELNAKGFENITVSELAPETAVFSIDVVGPTGIQHTQGEIAANLFTPILLTNSGPETITLVDYTRTPGSTPPNGNFVNTTSDAEVAAIPSLTQVDVVLDNVARGDASGSGDLVIGEMSEGGIQQFNVQVDRSSHLDQMASTNNVLEVINVENIGANGDLIINRIDDVRVFDASTMTGDVTLGAYLSGNVTEKYLNLHDTQTDPAEDNSETPYLNVASTKFFYDLGEGDDALTLAIDKANLINSGSTNREDFDLKIQGNAGADEITLMVYDNTGETPIGSGLGSSHWYLNSKLNANLSIDTGAGNDVVNAYGAGDRIINTGADNDTIYIDNSGDYPSGRKAIWVFNTHGAKDANVIDDQNGPQGDVGLGLLSDTNQTYHMYKVNMVVSFMGFEASVTVPTIDGYATDLQINQAIKAAINGDAELSKLLHASDGPANTLVIESLIDGDMDTYGVPYPAPLFTLTAPTAASLSAGDIATIGNAYGDSTPTAAEIVALIEADIDNFYIKGDYDPEYAETEGGSDYTGVNSVLGVGDNTITGGTGNDVIVLSTMGDDSSPVLAENFDSTHDTLAYSNDTIVYTGYGNGLDTVVNFQYGHETATQTLSIVDVDLVSYTQGQALVAAVAPTNVAESFTAQFNAVVANGTVTFNGVNVAVTAGQTAAQVAAAFVTAGVFGVYTATAGLQADQVVFTETTPAGVNLNDVEVGNFNVSGALFDTTPTDSGVVLAVVERTDGGTTGGSAQIDAATETFTVNFGQAQQAGTISFDGQSIQVMAGETGYNIAQAVQTGNYTNWTVVADADATDNQVTFISKTASVNVADAFTDSEASTPVIIHNEATITATEEDAVLDYQDNDTNVGAFSVPTYQVTGEWYYQNVDYIDFSDYIDYADVNATINGDQYDLSDATFGGWALANDTVSILNNPNLGTDGVFTSADLATTTLALDQIYMVESNAALQNGRYDIFHVSHAASTTASAVTVQLVGTIDFGAELTATGWVSDMVV